MSHDGKHVISASWDRSARLWELKTGQTKAKCTQGHSKDVVAVALSPPQRHIVTGCRDGKWRLFNARGELKWESGLGDGDKFHTDWVSCVKFSPVDTATVSFATGGWDGKVGLWNLDKVQLTHAFVGGHTGPVTSVDVSPDGSLVASASKDGTARLWDAVAGGDPIGRVIQAPGPISQLLFHPRQYWLTMATEKGIVVVDLQTHEDVALLVPETQVRSICPECISIAWAADGTTLYSGYTDNTIRVWGCAVTS